MLVGLPLSKFLMSLSQFILGINWLISGNYIEKLKKFWSRKELVFLFVFFLLHVVGLAWTSDFDYGFNDIKKKLPLLVFPVVFSSIELKKDEFFNFLKILVVAVVISTCLSMFKYFGIFWDKPDNPRALSIFYSHIRFGILLDLVFFIALFLFKNENSKVKYLWLIAACWIIIFSFILQSLTGLSILLVMFIILLIFWPTDKWKRLRAASLIVVVLLIGFIGYWTKNIVQQQIIPLKSQEEVLKKSTKQGSFYTHHLNSKLVENGNYVYINISYDELKKAWPQRSTFDFSGLDKKGQPLKATLIRFLASKGLDKDLEGIVSLSDKEIAAIENGVPNYLYMNISPFELRMRETIWEIGAYNSGKNPGGNTLTQRFEFWKVSFVVFKENLLFGVGTGDVFNEEQLMYDKLNSVLKENFRKKAHNQFLTTGVGFGIVGLIILLVVLLYPLKIYSFKDSPLFIVFLLISIMSFINEDMLDNQPGITFIAGFYGFLLSNKNYS